MKRFMRIAKAAAAVLVAAVLISCGDESNSYPIVSLSWVLLYGQYAEPEKAAALKEAMNWGLREGQPIAEEMGYIPLPEAIEAVAEVR
jgi:ABC-type phosphate transport system substrate-binding protein